MFRNHHTAQHLSWIAHQQFQQHIFFARQNNIAFAPVYLVCSQIEGNIHETQFHGLGRTLATQQGAHSCLEFAKGKRLRQVVVGPQIQPIHPVIDAIERGQKQDRRLLSLIS